MNTTHPDLTVTWDVSTYGAASALVDASRVAHTVVVGARGVGATRGALLGSVSTQVASHCALPRGRDPREARPAPDGGRPGGRRRATARRCR